MAASVWARARLRELEDRYVAGAGNKAALEKEIVGVSLRFGVLCRFTSYVAVDRAEVVNEGGRTHGVVQAVEQPAGWGAKALGAMPVAAAMPTLSAAPPPPPAAARPLAKRKIAESPPELLRRTPPPPPAAAPAPQTPPPPAPAPEEPTETESVDSYLMEFPSDLRRDSRRIPVEEDSGSQGLQPNAKSEDPSEEFDLSLDEDADEDFDDEESDTDYEVPPMQTEAPGRGERRRGHLGGRKERRQARPKKAPAGEKKGLIRRLLDLFRRRKGTSRGAAAVIDPRPFALRAEELLKLLRDNAAGDAATRLGVLRQVAERLEKLFADAVAAGDRRPATKRLGEVLLLLQRLLAAPQPAEAAVNTLWPQTETALQDFSGVTPPQAPPESRGGFWK
jgi:hypothetical protein